jgi:hypothetical protein
LSKIQGIEMSNTSGFGSRAPSLTAESYLGGGEGNEQLSLSELREDSDGKREPGFDSFEEDDEGSEEEEGLKNRDTAAINSSML